MNGEADGAKDIGAHSGRGVDARSGGTGTSNASISDSRCSNSGELSDTAEAAENRPRRRARRGCGRGHLDSRSLKLDSFDGDDGRGAALD